MNETTVGSDGDSADTSLTRWFLLTGNRLFVSLVVLLGIGTLFIVVGTFGSATMTRPSQVMWYLNGTVNGLLTLIPIAVGVNQIVLSHEFGSIQQHHQRRKDITEFRERIEDQTGRPARSPHPSTFFSVLLTSVSDTARALHQEHDHSREDGDLTDGIATLSRSISDEADRTNRKLTRDDTSTLHTLLAVLDYDNSYHFDELQRLETESPDFSVETTEQLHLLEELFTDIDAARQYLKTMVVERQLAQLSRLLIYTGIPAVTVAAFGIFNYRIIGGLADSHALLVLVVSALIVITLVPLVILAAYIVRVATIARRTAMYGPFVPGSNE